MAKSTDFQARDIDICTCGHLREQHTVYGDAWCLHFTAAGKCECCHFMPHPQPSETRDNINHPSHYKSGGMESIDVIEAFDFGFNLGNVFKYIARAGKKGPELDDLRKAAWYLNREIERKSK